MANQIVPIGGIETGTNNGVILQDVPDGGSRQGKLLATIRPNLAVGQVIVSMSAPEFEQRIRESMAKVALAVEEAKLPSPIRNLPVAERPGAQAKLDAIAAAMRQTFVGQHTWEGQAAFPSGPVGVTLKSHCQLDPNEVAFTQLSFLVSRNDTPKDVMPINGTMIYQGPKMFTGFLLNTTSWAPVGRERIQKEMQTAPLSNLNSLSNCFVRIIDDHTIELTAEGLPTTTFVKRK